MANKLYEETNIQAIADAIRSKNGSSNTYTVAQMAQAITDIPSGGIEIDNGTITQLYAGKNYVSDSPNISANNFIEFMTGQASDCFPDSAYYRSYSFR